MQRHPHAKVSRWYLQLPLGSHDVRRHQQQSVAATRRHHRLVLTQDLGRYPGQRQPELKGRDSASSTGQPGRGIGFVEPIFQRQQQFAHAGHIGSNPFWPVHDCGPVLPNICHHASCLSDRLYRCSRQFGEFGYRLTRFGRRRSWTSGNHSHCDISSGIPINYSHTPSLRGPRTSAVPH